MTAVALRDIAGPRMYRVNAFRVTGLPTDADRRTVRQRRQQVAARLDVGADAGLGHRLPVGPDDVRTAFDRILEDPRCRLVHEVLWLWGPADGAPCGCTRSLHRDHDAAVRAHSAALDLEVEGGAEPGALDRLWSEASERWARLLRRAAFWDHVRHRIEALDERQLDESFIDTLRARMPEHLLTPLVELASAAVADSADEAGRLAGRARGWPLVPPRAVDDALEEAAAHLYDAVAAALDKAVAELDADRPGQAARVLYERAVPALKKLEALVPHGRHRRTAGARDGAAVLFNNCAAKLIDDSGPAAARDARRWLGTARELASDPRGLESIRSNSATLDQIVRTFDLLRARVDELVAIGRPDVARGLLLDAKRQLRGGGGTAEIDRMLAGLGTRPARRQPAGAADLDRFLSREPDDDTLDRYFDVMGLPRPGADTRGHGRRGPVHGGVHGGYGSLWDDAVTALAYLLDGLRDGVRPIVKPAVVLALLAGLIWTWYRIAEHTPAPATSLVHAEKVADNVPVGSCIESRANWRGERAEAPVVPCEEPHRGEILGYARLGAVPSPYPGDDQAEALARFSCGLLLARQGLPAEQYTTDHVRGGAEDWNTGGKAYENYATCVLHRADDKPLPRERLTDPGRGAEDAAVRMSLAGPRIRQNAPVGGCLADRRGWDTSRHDVPVVHCSDRHWGEILGYPVLYRQGDPWPGDKAVSAEAERACARVADERELPSGFRVNVSYPARAWWDDPKAQLYAVCVASRNDDLPFSGGLG
ncbi:hypothetical protein [Streptomyces capparidis]